MVVIDKTAYTFKSVGIDRNGPCSICGEYGDWLIGIFGGDRERVCEKHKDEYLYGDTGWWELTRLVTEAVNDS